jgi:hypothetical protein
MTDTTKAVDPLDGIEPSAYQCREHGQDDWHICSKEGFGLNTFRYVYRKLYAPDAIQSAIERARADERERCRQLCVRQYAEWMEAHRLFGTSDGTELARAAVAEELAAAIHALSTKT